MNKGRIEAFSDGVIAIIITIMVLELKVPHGSDWTDLKPVLPVFMSYLLSFIYLGIYWNNHHHMFQAIKQVSGTVLLANLYLLFCLSLVPFVTAWMGENLDQPIPVALYGIVLLNAAIGYYVLQQILLRKNGENTLLSKAIGSDFKGKASLVLYILAVASAFIHVLIAEVIYGLVALIWIIPDKRIEKVVDQKN